MAAADPAAKPRSDLPVRVASAVVMVAVAGCAFWLGGWALRCFIIAIGLGIFAEWTALVRGFERDQALRWPWFLAGLLYIGFAIWAALAIGPGLIVCVTLVAAIDIGAYFAGRTIGGPKIAPAISPSKTWSGLFGGILGATAVFLTIYRDGNGYGPGSDGWGDGSIFPFAFLAGAVMAIVAQTGDFFESWMKRRAGVKDSGRLIPGHGGLFDRADGLIAVLFVIGVVVIATGCLGRVSTPLPFRGGVGGGASPHGAALGEGPHPNPSPEGEGLHGVSGVHLRLFVLRIAR